MALFREHIAFGAVLASIGVTLLYFYAFVTDPVLLGVLFLVTVLGSFLPDIDSDTGVPFYLAFGTATLGCGAFALYYLLMHPPQTIYFLVGVPFATIIFVWFVVGTIFKRLTHHRGIMHSIPAMFIAGLTTFLAARSLEQGDYLSLIFASAVSLGVASHLLLDEIHSENLMDGNPFVHKRSLGTALKLFSRSAIVNIFTYTIIAANQG
jgi:membrane-bound metal-dependent hydrolase YbcI (DUF457 family)